MTCFPVDRILAERVLPDGGFPGQPGGGYMPDATAWAILAFAGSGIRADLLCPARSRLAADQLDDGRISVAPEHPEAFWTTPLAILAWQGSPAHREHQARAIRFLLRTTGRHWKKDSGSPVGHDTSITGWPWVADTHSMVEPTATSILALRTAGHAGHERVREAVRMLLDRQLPDGGWNYGNTVIYGKGLHPFPDSTGLALSALSGLVARNEIRRSLDYLESRLKQVRTPRSLGWGLMGLHAWGIRPPRSRAWLLDGLRRQGQLGPCDTCSLGLMVLALSSRENILVAEGRNG